MDPNLKDELLQYLTDEVNSFSLTEKEANSIYEFAIDKYDSDEFSQYQIKFEDVLETVVDTLDIDVDMYEDADPNDICADLRLRVYESFMEGKIPEDDMNTMIEYLDLNRYNGRMVYKVDYEAYNDNEENIKAMIEACVEDFIVAESENYYDGSYNAVVEMTEGFKKLMELTDNQEYETPDYTGAAF